MTEYLTISKTKPPFPPYLDFQTLRDLGIKHLQKLSGKIWTDYNLHDPGVTILEVLCYAITDLGYRNNFELKDLLALKPGDADSRENNFFTPDEILTCNPLTELDWRKRLIDIDGVRNAWLEKVDTYAPAISINWAESRLQYAQNQSQSAGNFNPRGLYRVWLDLDPTYRKDPCGQLYRSRSPILEEVNQVLCSYRNLCEDIHEIVVLEDEEIALCTDIELAPDADPEDVLVEVYVRLQSFLLPRIQFYTLQALLEKGKSITEIFAGRPSALPDHDNRFASWPTNSEGDRRPYSHGFIDVDELQVLTPPKVLHTSDLYQVILQVPGVSAVRKLSISNYINGLRQSRGEPWVLSLTPGYRPILGIDYSQINLYKGDLPLPFDQAEVKRRYFEQQAAAIKTPRDAYELDLSVPQGTYYDTLADHYSIQHDFPLTYGISEDGLPETVPTLRKAQARQLKGYLVFFDQLLANYLAQLAHVRDLFSWELDQGTKNPAGRDTPSSDRPHTYFTQALDFPAWPDILTDARYLEAITEDEVTYRDRRNRFLDHLLARFAESFSEYALLNYQLHQNGQDKAAIETNLIEDKANFLQDYPALGRDRNRAFNYAQSPIWDTDNVSGFEQRVARLLGIEDLRRRNLSHYRLNFDPASGRYIGRLEDASGQILLRGMQSYRTLQESWQHSNDLMELAQNEENFQLIDKEDGAYGWQLTTDGQAPILAVHYYPTAEERDAALAALKTYIRDIYLNAEGFHILEHILLRPRTVPPPPLEETSSSEADASSESEPVLDNFLPIAVTPEDASTLIGDPEHQHLIWQDPYSFWITVVLPYWPTRFQNMNVRRFVEQTLRLEAPAHIALRIAWVGPGQMRAFEEVYSDWLQQLALASQGGAACDLTGTLNRLIELLPQLQSVYPEATLYSRNPEVSDPEDTPFVLNQTALGTTEE